MRRGLLVALLAAAVAAVWAATGSGSGDRTSGTPAQVAAGTSVTISNEQGGTWTCGFNPLNANLVDWSFGPVYESLVFVDELKSGAATPWLASKYKWSNHNKTITFTIRSGVKWSDGKPLTAADVLYTFQLLKKHKALDLQAVWAELKSVTRKGNTVTFQFKTPAVPYFYYVAGQTPIVPQHIWKSIKDPVTDKITDPIGSGPYTISHKTCSPQEMTYHKNPHYWQKGKPKIDTVYYPAYLSNDPANQDLASGKAQWGSQFIPSIKTFYLSKSKDNHYWFPPVDNVYVFMNLKNPLLKDVAIRRAMAYAIDRSRVSKIGEYGYEPPANQTGIVTPTFKTWLDKSLAKKFTYDPTKAKSILTKAGYKFSGGVFHTKSGKPLSFTMVNIGDYSDWVSSAQIVIGDLKAIGIKVTASNLSSTTYDNDVYTGKYDLAYDGNEAGGPAPYYELRQVLYSPNSAPIGQIAGSNWERYYNKKVDSLIKGYAATTSSAKQHSIVNQLEAAMVRDVPVIPVTEGVDWYQYNTSSISGWVTKKDPFAKPAAYEVPDWGVMLLHLKPKG
jgi:peptide/nickel transport system substrate-binding protein